MRDLPHRYRVAASAAAEGPVELESAGLPALATEPPAEFGGPGDRWSPETLLVGAIADCFVLTFRAIARASQLAWTSLTCEAEGTLDRADRKLRFTSIALRARLRVPSGTDPEKAQRLLEKSEQGCLITNSLLATAYLDAQVEVA